MISIAISSVLKRLKIRSHLPSTSTTLASYSPVDGQLIAHVVQTTEASYQNQVEQANQAFSTWKQIPAPKRGEIVRQIGTALRAHKEDLGALVSYEMGKSLQEGYGEVQEMIDICDFAVGLSRQLYGLTTQSERPQHRMYEQWHPLGVVGIISAFNFPVAVWSWNAAIAWVCGNTCIWKPSEKTPITAEACQQLVQAVFTKNQIPQAVSCLIQGDASLGTLMANDSRIPLISATGSTRMGKSVAQAVATRLGKSILELGGNNAIIITQHTDLDTALLASIFGAIGTAGQRCTSTRRLIIHASIYEQFKQRLVKAYQQIRIGNPLDEKNHVGPLIDEQAVQTYLSTIEQCKKEGGKLVVEGGLLSGPNYPSSCYVKPCVVEMPPTSKITHQETFAPILYLMKYDTLEEAIAIQNHVPQGLSSAIMTLNLKEAEHFLSVNGSDCGIANVNIGTSGAEIGGAFGGEKETGGGRESGSDAWKAYMRRQTTTINFSDKLPLAQGIKFDL
ncbi:aldehyde dehydrogenase family protein [Olivibacter ginsenosidimutans]|uniref:aldehyde dehydrogenase (NAD(+)) n=1 Tax=Olivibacter ginsenosidimutans TaxID=1176537 RepID=A0ABP9AIU1_9SPHI